MNELKKNTLDNLKRMRDFSFIEETNKKSEKRVRYSSDTKMTLERKKSTTMIDHQGDIVRPIVINSKYYIRHDQLCNKMAIYGIF